LVEEIDRTFSPLPKCHAHSCGEWEAGFIKDVRPWNEISYFVRAARAFRRLTDGQDTDTEQQGDVYWVVSHLLSISPKEVAKKLPRTVSQNKFKRILKETQVRGQLTAAEVEALEAYRAERAPVVRAALREEGLKVGNLFDLPPPWEGDV
jgi:hypothetical protein